MGLALPKGGRSSIFACAASPVKHDGPSWASAELLFIPWPKDGVYVWMNHVLSVGRARWFAAHVTGPTLVWNPFIADVDGISTHAALSRNLNVEHFCRQGGGWRADNDPDMWQQRRKCWWAKRWPFWIFWHVWFRLVISAGAIREVCSRSCNRHIHCGVNWCNHCGVNWSFVGA